MLKKDNLRGVDSPKYGFVEAVNTIATSRKRFGSAKKISRPFATFFRNVVKGLSFCGKKIFLRKFHNDSIPFCRLLVVLRRIFIIRFIDAGARFGRLQPRHVVRLRKRRFGE